VMQTGFLWGGLKERVHFEDLGVDRPIILKLIFKRWDAEARVGLIWLMTGTCWALSNAVLNLRVP